IIQSCFVFFYFFFQAEDGIRDGHVTGVQTCALPICCVGDIGLQRGRRMQGLVLQLTRVGFLLLLWLFIWSVLRILRTDIYAPTGAVMVRRGLALRGTLLPARQRRHAARYLVVTEGALTGARITLSGQPVLIGRADDSTLV